MAKRINKVSVAGSVLKWARETIGKTPDETAKRLGLSKYTVSEWEKGENSPTLRELKDLAGFYKRPLAAFFLPSPPQEPPLPADFRALPEMTAKRFSDKTLLALRRARRLQALAVELSTSLGRQLRGRIEKTEIKSDIQTLAAKARKSLKVDLETQFSWKDENTALAGWKKAVEARAVLVTELSFPIKEGRAFSLADNASAVIVLNSKDAVSARIFSLFHEYAHLMLGQGGICDFSREDEAVERFCNRFAGELLVPKEALLQNPMVEKHPRHSEWLNEEIQRIAGQYKVSREVILLRFLALGLINRSFYQKMKRKQEEEMEKQLKVKTLKLGQLSPVKKCLRQNGTPFVSLVLESAHQEKITHRDVSDYLSISLKHLPEIESLVREESARYGRR